MQSDKCKLRSLCYYCSSAPSLQRFGFEYLIAIEVSSKETDTDKKKHAGMAVIRHEKRSLASSDVIFVIKLCTAPMAR